MMFAVDLTACNAACRLERLVESLQASRAMGFPPWGSHVLV
jgi:hypothetical protein